MEFVLEENKHLNKESQNLVLVRSITIFFFNFIFLFIFNKFYEFESQPALSIGNVGQLAVDLLVSSTRAETVGYLDDPFVLPCVGNDAYCPNPGGDLALPLQGSL